MDWNEFSEDRAHFQRDMGKAEQLQLWMEKKANILNGEPVLETPVSTYTVPPLS